jgi:hypothetical protein|tara:strand:- start:74 stop:262 length:189 start_codon:yes stop_codon:yes gene_type:complete
MINYLIVGIVFTFIIDTMNNNLKSRLEFTNFERIICVMVWPIGLFSFIVGIIEEFLNNKKDD